MSVEQEDIVYIIEMPGPIELLNDQLEGKALSKALDICRITNQYFLVVNQELLRAAFEHIRDDIQERYKTQGKNVVSLHYVHISCHGSKDALGVTDGSELTWPDLDNLLGIINNDPKVGFHTSHGIKYSQISLCLSACYGYSATKMDYGASITPYAVLIAPYDPIEFAESIVAYSTFYHLMCNKGLDGVEAVNRMNLAAAPGTIIDHHISKEFEQLIKAKKRVPTK